MRTGRGGDNHEVLSMEVVTYVSRKRFYFLVVVLAAGIGASVVFGRLWRPFATSGYRDLRVPLAEFPTTIGEWRGEDREIDPHVRKLTAMDRGLRREYASPREKPVLLYVVWYGNRDRGLETIFHNPTVCYPAAGYTQVSSEILSVPVDGRAHPIEATADVYRSPGGGEVEVVSFFVLDEGRIFARPPRNDVVGLGVEKLRPSFSPGYFAQVQVTTAVAGDEPSARARAVSFLRAAAGILLDHF